MPDGNDPATIRDLCRLQEFIDIKIEHLKTLRGVDKESSERALSLATAELARRLDGLNNEAGRIRDIEKKTVTRETYDIMVDVLKSRLGAVETEQAVLRGKASQKAVNVTLILSVLGLILGIAGILIKVL